MIRWAGNDPAGRPYVLSVRVDQDGPGLVRLAGRDPNESPSGVGVVVCVTYYADREDDRSPEP